MKCNDSELLPSRKSCKECGVESVRKLDDNNNNIDIQFINATYSYFKAFQIGSKSIRNMSNMS